MSKTLIIVESAGKVDKIESLLGKNYKVMASYGHIIDLASGSMSIDIENGFEPTYSVIEPPKKATKFKVRSKKEIIAGLKKAMKESKEVLLASDEDREGEMIAWSLAYVMGLKNPKRITFNAITKSELEKAVKSPRQIDQNLVDAQKARRILDRIVGYEISPILWKQIGAQLSAGRVQSVVARLVVDKEREVLDFLKKGAKSYFKFIGNFYDTKNKIFQSQLFTTKKLKDDFDDENNEDDENSKKNKKTKNGKKDDQEDNQEDNQEDEEIELKGTLAKIPDESSARNLLKLMSKSEFKMGDITERDKLRQPSAPFTTSTLQQEASRKLGFGVKRTMQAAQNLYEAGYITYMRTDSVNLSKEALENIKSYVIDKYGKQYHQEKNYKQKKANTQEAHEAVRPTDVFDDQIEQQGKIKNDEIRLYNLIWKRAIASQMSPAKIKEKGIQINISKTPDYYFMTKVESIIFQGFLAVYNLVNLEKEDNGDVDTESNLGIDVPKKGVKLTPNNIVGQQEYQRPPVRYNEASLINKLDPKNLNIGRPATYGPILEKILEKDYVKLVNIEGEEKDSIVMSWNGEKIQENIKKIILGKENNKLVPTSLGMLVNDFLMKHFPKIMDYKFTAQMEENLDSIAEGSEKWVDVLQSFYDTFHPIVEEMNKLKTKVKDEKNRILGKHPESGAEILATLGKYGPMLKMCTTKTKCVYAPIKPPLTIETITFNDALKLFEFPKDLGKFDGTNIILNKGKFGLYLTYGEKKISLNKKKNIDKDNKKDGDDSEQDDKSDEEDDIEYDENITYDQAVELVKKIKKDILWEAKDDKLRYEVKEGPFGKYIKVTDTASKKVKKHFNVKLPNDIDISSLTLEKVKNIVSNRSYGRKGKQDNTKDKKENNNNNNKQEGGRKKILNTKTTKKVNKPSTKKPIKKK